MKLFSNIWLYRLANLVVLAAVLFGFVNPLQAGTFTGNSLATFGSYGPSNSTPYTSESNGTYSSPTSTFTSGSGDPNILTMVGQSFNTNASTPFVVSSLSYYNGITGVAATDVAVNIGLQFTAPALPTQSFAFAFHFDITPNSYSPLSNPLNDDILTPQNVFSSTTFSYNGDTYTLHLLGFSSDGGNTITSSFMLPEQDTVSSDLYAEITTNLGPSAPEPATLTLLGVGIAGMAGYRWRRKQAAPA